jgi:hypothetical protein
MAAHTGISGINFAGSLSWIQTIHSKYFAEKRLIDYLVQYQVLFTERAYILSERLSPQQQLFDVMGITPSHYLKLKNTLIEQGGWIPKSFKQKFSPAIFFSQLYSQNISINRKARCLAIHLKQYEALSTLREIQIKLHALRFSQDKDRETIVNQ